MSVFVPLYFHRNTTALHVKSTRKGQARYSVNQTNGNTLLFVLHVLCLHIILVYVEQGLFQPVTKKSFFFPFYLLFFLNILRHPLTIILKAQSLLFVFWHIARGIFKLNSYQLNSICQQLLNGRWIWLKVS